MESEDLEGNKIHNSGHVHLSIIDQKLVSGSTDKLTSSLLTQINQGYCSETNVNAIPTKVDCLCTTGQFIIIGIGSKVVLHKLAGLKMSKTLSQRQGQVRALSVDQDGNVAIGSDEIDIHIVNIFRPDFEEVLVGHKKAIKTLGFHPRGGVLVSGSADGTLKIWNKWQCTLTLDDIIPTSLPEVVNRFISWDPTGVRYAVTGDFGDVVILNQAHKMIKKLEHTDDICSVRFSPNGLYLFVGTKSTHYVWHVDQEKKMVERKHNFAVCDAVWAEKGNIVYFSDTNGEVWAFKNVIRNGTLPAQPVEDTDEALFGEEVDDEVNDLAPFANLEADEDLENDDFVVDDDGNGYAEDLQTDQGYKRYNEKSNEIAKKGLDSLIREMEMDRVEDEEPLRTAVGKVTIQSPFQPGSIPPNGNRHYLTLNFTGTVCVIDNGETYTVDVDFHDSSKRPFHFSDNLKFTMGALNSAGCVLASEATTSESSTVLFRQIDSWTSRTEWSVTLPDNESAVAVGVSNQIIAVATNQQYLRFFTPSGIQTYLRSVPGPVITMAGHGSLMFVVYHLGYSSTIGYQLVDTAMMKTIKTDVLCISPHSELFWVGFTESGIPLTYDSLGVLRGLFLHSDAAWVPIFDLRIARKSETDWYFPVGANDKQLFCVVCRGDKFPVFPKPIIIDIAMSIPFCMLESERFAREQRLLHHRLFLGEYKNTRDQLVEETARRELEMDKIILPLFLAACKGKLSQRALELSFDLSHLRSLDGAIRVASNNQLQALTERLMTLKEVRARELEADGTINLRHQLLIHQPTQHQQQYQRVDYEDSRTQEFESLAPKRRRNPLADAEPEVEPPKKPEVDSVEEVKKTAEKKKQRNPFSAMKEKVAEVVTEPKTCFEMIEQTAVKEKPVEKVQEKKRKQTSLLDLMKQPPAEKKAKVISIAPTESSSKERQEQQTTLDKFAGIVQNGANEQTLAGDEMPQSQVMVEEEEIVPKSKGKGIADPSLSLASFQYNKH